MQIRSLTQDDVTAWRTIRARMLTDHPEAFGEHADDHATRSDAELAERLAGGNVIGAWLDGTLIGTVGWVAGKGKKRAHVAEIWGMFVAPEARRKAAARRLLRAAIDASRAIGVCVWELGVEENNHGARALYESEGFVVWGTEPDAYRVNGRTVNIQHMSRLASLQGGE